MIEINMGNIKQFRHSQGMLEEAPSSIYLKKREDECQDLCTTMFIFQAAFLKLCTPFWDMVMIIMVIS